MFSFLFFFFYCYADHRDLHSFPTRRSSDLADRHNLVVVAVQDQGRHVDPLQVPGEVRDRKSTRLNSSHVAISYAVFCLKKKKKSQSSSLQLNISGTCARVSVDDYQRDTGPT